MRTDFVANASHELRTPLSAIRAAVETLQQLDPQGEAASVRSCVEVIDRHSTRLVDLVADLLDLSRLESPEAQFPVQRLRLGEFLDELRWRLAPAIEANGLTLEIDRAADCEELTASPQLLRLVLDNLVDNAMKFTARGGVVRVVCRCTAEGTSLEVADNGCGIPEEQQSRVFERFYQVQLARSGHGSDPAKVRGTGLGLAIVRHAVAAMKGSIRLWSQVGMGTRVTVIVPSPGAAGEADRRSDGNLR
jgi:signal transduction histidine kinase